jgi:hypothetical protein
VPFQKVPVLGIDERVGFGLRVVEINHDHRWRVALGSKLQPPAVFVDAPLAVPGNSPIGLEVDNGAVRVNARLLQFDDSHKRHIGNGSDKDAIGNLRQGVRSHRKKN